MKKERQRAKAALKAAAKREQRAQQEQGVT